MFVHLALIHLRRVNFSVDSRRHNVVDGLALRIFFDVKGRNVKGSEVGVGLDAQARLGEVLEVASPLAAHKLEAGKTQDYRLVKTFHVDAHETNRAEILNAVDAFFKFANRYFELVPSFCFGAVLVNLFVGDEVATHILEVVLTQTHAVLEIGF